MLNKFINKFNPTIEGLTKEILDGNFSEKSAKKILNSSNVDINKQDENGETILHFSLKDHRYMEALWLIDQGADANIEDKNGITAVRIAIQRGRSEIIEKLITDSKIDIEQLDRNNRTLLQDAVLYGHSKIITILSNYTKNINSVDKNNRSVVFDAIAYGDNEITNELLKNKDLDLNIVDNDGKTILHQSKIEDDEELSIKLLENGADPTINDKDGTNFLLKVALKGKYGESILKTAVRLGCDLDTKVSNKNSIFMEVMFAFLKIPSNEIERRKELKDMAKNLIKYGIDIAAINNQDETVLFELIRAGDIESCAFVIENGVNINHQNDEKETALSIAIAKGVENMDMVILLLQYGADPSIKNKDNQCVPEVLNNIILHTHSKKELTCQKTLASICSNGNYLVILREILRGSKIKYNYMDSTGNPLFFTPFLYDNFELTKIYLKIGVDINLKNENGNNLFYEYNLKIFEKGIFTKIYKNSLVFLLVNRCNILAKDKDNHTIYSKIALIPNCNIDLFRLLVEVTNYDYSIRDNRGRTIMHSCVWGNNLELVSIIYSIEHDVQNIYDNYNILPIAYAALLGNKKIVKEFLQNNSNISSGREIPKVIIDKFKPMMENLNKLLNSYENEDYLRKLEILVDTIKRDFKD